MRLTLTFLSLLVVTLALVSCAQTSPHNPSAGRAENPSLANLLEISPGVFTGGAPELPEGYQTLAAMGVRTVLAVDAAPPRLDALHANGLVSVHIPIEYSGVSKAQRAALIKALATLPRPIYIHCHHGKHRAPAAACVALLGTGEIDQKQAAQVLKDAGTSPHYPGLFDAVRNTTLHPDPASIVAELPEVASIAPIAETMAMIERQFERLELVKDNGWRVPEDHPDLSPVELAGMVEANLRALSELPGGGMAPPIKNWLEREVFTELMLDTATKASSLESAIAGSDLIAANEAWALVESGCNNCHKVYRNGH